MAKSSSPSTHRPHPGLPSECPCSLPDSGREQHDPRAGLYFEGSHRPPHGRARSGRPAHPSRSAPSPRGRPRGLAGLGAGRPPRGVRRARDRASLAAPGRRRRRRACRPPRRPGDRHGVRQVPRLPAADTHEHPEKPRYTRGTRRHCALPGPHEGTGSRPAGGPAGPRHRRTVLDPRRRQSARAARLDPRPRRVRPDQPRHAAPIAAARAHPMVRVPGLAAVRRGRRVPPLPRGLRRPRRPDPAPAPPDLRAVRRAPDLRARLGHDGRARSHRRTAHWSGRRGRHRTTNRPAVRSRWRCGSRRSRRGPARTAHRSGGPRRRRRPTCWPTWWSRTSAPSPSSGPGAARSRWR